MYDFRDVNATTKDEQIRAWSIEQAVDASSGSVPTSESLVRKAALIEQFVIHGNTEGAVE